MSVSSSTKTSVRGRQARQPRDIPAAGWWDIAWRVIKRLGSDNVTFVAGGVAMYALLSVFPGLAAAVSIYGLFSTPDDVIRHLSAFSGVLPPAAWDIVKEQLQSITRHEQSTLSIAASVGLIVAIWSARSALSALMTATNIAYGEREKRSFLQQILISLVLTVGAVAGFLIMLLLGIALPTALNLFGTRPAMQIAADVVQWAVLWVFGTVSLAFVYRYAPAREPARWHWVSWGSAIATTLWLGASALFAIYVKSFANYGKTYGALGGVIALLMWFYISSVIVVLGAEINAEMERQTARDTTEGQEAPLGERGAYAADTVGPSAGEPDRSPGSDRGMG